MVPHILTTQVVCIYFHERSNDPFSDVCIYKASSPLNFFLKPSPLEYSLLAVFLEGFKTTTLQIVLVVLFGLNMLMDLFKGVV